MQSTISGLEAKREAKNSSRAGMLGIPIGTRRLDQLTEQALKAIGGELPPVVFACANPHSLVTARTDRVFFEALQDADQVVADGVGIVLMSKVIGGEIAPRITGTDYFFSVMRSLDRAGKGRIFFFGSSQKVLDLIAGRMAEDFRNLTLCGAISPPYRPWSDEENRQMIAKINAAKPDVLWVGMTAPKQEKWVYGNRDSLAVPVIGSIGAVFDFYAGTYPRAPRWMCDLGMEWLYRFIAEPKRMWRRNFVSTPLFIGAVLAEHVSGVRAK
jgi:N-acetylglucosaminyldiphosphoundecaprenol N-acetyl-beta-D-mannosaminyltransferase